VTPPAGVTDIKKAENSADSSIFLSKASDFSAKSITFAAPYRWNMHAFTE